MPPFLATTALTEFWDTQVEKILFLGHWCMRYDRQHDWKHLNYEVLPHPWDDRQAMHRVALYEEEVYEETLEALSGFLNNVHGEKKTSKYWRIILGPWLLHYIQALDERYLCLKAAFEAYPNLRTIGLARSSFNIPRHFYDHLVGVTADPYNLQLYTTILHAMNYPVHEERNHRWQWEAQCESGASTLVKGVRRKLRWLWERVGTDWAQRAPVLMVDMYIPFKQVFYIMAATRFKARWCALPKPEKWVREISDSTLDTHREELGSLTLSNTDPFRCLLLKTLSFNFPAIYLERYSACREWVKVKCRKSASTRLLTANALDLNESFKFIAAELIERGAKITAIQHGGAYGTMAYSPFEGYERRAADQFWSWGWGKGLQDVRPMPNPKLSDLEHRYTPRRKRRVGLQYILFIGNIIPRYHYRTWSCPTANQGIEYLNWQIRFLTLLEPKIRADLVFRPYSVDYGWALRERLEEACPDIHIDDPMADYYDELLGASLVICDMNQTTILECLAANIPTIAFWNPLLWELRPDAKPFFDGLHAAGILHYDPADAAAAVNTIWENTNGWWKSVHVQKARDAFTLHFALSSRDWIKEWREALVPTVSNDSAIKELPI